MSPDYEADFFATAGDGRRLVSVLLAADLLDRVARLCAVHELRAHDAVELGSTLAVREVESSCRTVAASDAGLRRAAAAEGSALRPPT